MRQEDKTKDQILEDLKHKELLWKVGHRRFIIPLLSIATAIITAYIGFYLPARENINNEQFTFLVEQLDSEDEYLILDAVEQLKEYDERAYTPLRKSLLKNRENHNIKELILAILPEDLGLKNKVEAGLFKQDLQTTTNSGWIYLGNYNPSKKEWQQQNMLGDYNYTILLSENKEPNEIIGKAYALSVPIRLRSKPLKNFNDPQESQTRIKVLSKGTNIKILKLKNFEHSNISYGRYWAYINLE